MSSLNQKTPAGYKQTDIGVIPNDWMTSNLGDICILINGRGFKPYEWSREGLPIIRIQNLNGSDEFNYYEGHYNPKILIKHGQLLFAWSGSRGTSFGPHIWYGEDALLNYHTWKMDIKSGIEPSYFYHALKNLTKIIENSAHGASALVHTQMGEMKKFIVPIPDSKQEQTAIANALSDVDALIQELEKLIAKKQAIKTATMQQLLTGRTRLPQFAHYPDGRKKGYKPSELGEIPEDWEVCDLGNAAKVQGGFAFKSDKFAMQGVPIIRIGNIQSGLIDTTDLVYYPHGEQVPKQFEVIRGDALIAMSGATTGKVGIYDSSDKAFTNQRVGKFVAASNNVNMGFIHQLVGSELYKNLLESQLEQGAQPNVSSNQLESIQIRLPSDKTEQEQIALLLTEMDQDLQSLEKRLNKTRQIKQGMMQELLTGKTRLVKPVGDPTDAH